MQASSPTKAAGNPQSIIDPRNQAPAPRPGSTPSVIPGKGGEILDAILRAEVGMPIVVLSILVVMILPLPSWLLDLLISLNMSVSVVVLLVSMYITKPVEFSVFPAALLLLTLFRLALNVASSRLILLNGNGGTAAAGEVIEAFGNFVVGGNFIIGTVMFLVLIAIQYVVINHGAVRISEVTARFTLDALPGKQMSIDSDLNAGLIDEAEAKDRRKKLAQEAEFYGAMDGASRFTQRDAVAGILIVSINIIAGFLIGVFQHGMDLLRALQTYTILTIGDGLVTVIPALMISISGGLIVTRASSEGRLDAEVRRQLFTKPQPLMLSGCVLVGLALIPGLPKIPFLLLGAGTLYLAKLAQKQIAEQETALPPAAPAPPAKDSIESLLKVEPIAVEVGLGLVRLVEGGAQSILLKRIASIRRQLATELGYILPAVRVSDNLSLKSREYRVLVKGNELARYELLQGCDLAIPSSELTPEAKQRQAARMAELNGIKTQEPAFLLDAWWVPQDRADRARAEGFTVIDIASVLSTHFAEICRRHAHEIYSRQDAKKFLDRVAEENPKVVEDLVPKLLPLASVQKVLQNLLRERVSIRDGLTILESMGEASGMTKNPILITEFVRQAIRRSITRPFQSPNGEITAWFLEPGLEQELDSAVEHGELNSHWSLPPLRMRELLNRFHRAIPNPQTAQVVLVGTNARHFLRQATENVFPNLHLLSHSEIPAGIKLLSLGQI